MASAQRILDPCCGSRMFWFDKDNPEVVFGDIRRESGIIYDGRDGRRSLSVAPDEIMDFTELPFEDGRFNLVVFDPPHLNNAGPKSWQAAKYGKLPKEWRAMISKGFSECFRVLAENGVLIFKWGEIQISLREILSLTDIKPLFGQTTTVSLKTHWIVFMKPLASAGKV
jgi:SAM-dependent methyltransferase